MQFRGCHASQYGKGEFKLSLFGFAPEEDHPQIARDWNQRRLSLIDPADSLILKKPTLQVSHGGGQRFDVDSIEYHVLLEWITSGAPLPNDEDPHVVGMTVYPGRASLRRGRPATTADRRRVRGRIETRRDTPGDVRQPG